MKVFGDYEGALPTGVNVVVEGNLMRVRFDYEDMGQMLGIDGEEMEDAPSRYKCECVDVWDEHDYAHVVSAIVRSRYNSDDVQAIIANKALADDATSEISEEKRTEYVADYKAFQTWRAKAKEVAGTVCGG